VIHKSKHIPALDGLRGLAVLAVMFHHSVPNFQSLRLEKVADFGWIGVDLFFVLSGFLITGILVDSKGQGNYFRGFYWRRVLRIWPLYYGLVLLVYLIGPHLRLATNWNISAYSPWIYIFFLQNVLTPDWGIYPLTPTWSLAIEEQFYLIWPLAVRFLSARILRSVLIALLVLSPVARGVAVHFGTSWHFVYTLPWLRLDGLAIGGLIAIVLREQAFVSDKWKSYVKAVLAIGVVGATVTLWRHALPLSGLESIWIYSWLALMFGAILFLAIVGKPASILEARWLRYVGEISYGLYLLHTPVFAFVNVLSRHVHASGRIFDFTIIVMKFLLVTIVASMSWFAMERPILGLKKYFQPQRDAKELAVSA
jgi:peptidoglycan/LPS O-acetylase OafA/YrhL